MNRRFLWLPLLALVAALALLAGVSISAAQAAPAATDGSDGLRIDSDAMAKVADIAKRSEAYLVKNADGTVTLNLDNAAAIGATDKFLADYKAALANINAEIRAGHFKAQADGTLKVAADAKAPTQKSAAPAGLKLPAGATLVENPTAEQLAAARPAPLARGQGSPSLAPDWNVVNNGYFYVTWTSYDAYWYRYYPYYYTWPAAMAAYVGYPYISTRLVYLFTYSYNYPYFTSATYPFGVYWYIPWNYLCNVCGVGYYPVYFYTRYVYYYYGYYYYGYTWRGYYLYF